MGVIGQLGPRAVAAAALLASLWCASAARAVTIEVVNGVDRPIEFGSTSSDCWNLYDLSPLKRIGPGSSRSFYSESSGNIACRFRSGGEANLRLRFLNADGTTSDPQVGGDASGVLGRWSLAAKSNTDWYNPDNYFLRNHPPSGSFIPLQPTVGGAYRGAGTGGMYCFANSPFGRSLDGKDVRTRLIVTSQRCGHSGSNVPRARAAARSAGDAGGEAVPARAAASEQDDAGTVYDVFQLVRSACELLRLPIGATSCADVTDQSKWDLDNLTLDTRSAKPVDQPLTSNAWRLVQEFEQENHTQDNGTLSYTISAQVGQTVSNQTQHGWSFGSQQSFQPKVLEVSLGTFQLSESYSGSITQSTTSNTVHTETMTQTATARPGGTTYVFVYQGESSASFHWSADLTFGRSGIAEPVQTPAAVALGQSPSRLQPCLGYVLGPSSADNSLADRGRQALALGYSATTPGMPADQKAFLRALAGIRETGGAPCPGFPASYPADGAFVGDGYLQARVLGGAGDTVGWPNLKPLKVCTYFVPFDQAQKSSATPGAGGSPCGPGANGPPSAKVNAVVDGGEDPTDSQHAAGAGSQLYVGDESADVDHVQLGPGGFDVAQGGSGAERIDGGPGTDVVTGGGGSDVVAGGTGDDTLAGGPGADRLRDLAGDNVLEGGAGDDRLSSGGQATGALDGGSGEDVLALTGDDAEVALRGGSGDDRYVLREDAPADTIVEGPSEGIDTVVVDTSLRLPPGVERAVSGTSAGVRLVGGSGDDELRGGRGDDRLIGGDGSDRVVGGRGEEVIVLGELGFDEVTGGPGADRFVARAHPLSESAAGLQPPRRPTAHTITDFAPRRGDRLVLGPASYGREIRRARLVQARSPRARGGRPALLFDTTSGLLSFDRDGDGALPPQVIAILEGVQRLPRTALVIR